MKCLIENWRENRPGGNGPESYGKEAARLQRARDRVFHPEITAILSSDILWSLRLGRFFYQLDVRIALPASGNRAVHRDKGRGGLSDIIVPSVRVIQQDTEALSRQPTKPYTVRPVRLPFSHRFLWMPARRD